MENEKEMILVIEDEQKIARFIELELKHEGYNVEISKDGVEGYERAIEHDYSVIILDLMLPGLSGVEVCRRIRRQKNTPIIMLTAKDDVSDIVTGLDSGANDYMTKPFAIEELLARIRALLKRNMISIQKVNASKVISVDKLIMDCDKYSVRFNTTEVMMTRTEFSLLRYLMQNVNIVLTRDKILEHVWGYDYVGDTNVVDVYIRYLRAKIDNTFNVKYIHTIRGVGYSLRYKLL